MIFRLRRENFGLLKLITSFCMMLLLPACFSPEKSKSNKMVYKLKQTQNRKLANIPPNPKTGVIIIKEKEENLQSELKIESNSQITAFISDCPADSLFHKGECIKKQAPCLLENGEGQKKWNNDSYGECNLTQCDTGFRKHQGQCVAICQEDEVFFDSSCKPLFEHCSSDGKDGIKIWDEQGYGTCQI